MYRRTLCAAIALVACKKSPISIKADADKLVVEGSDVTGDVSMHAGVVRVSLSDKAVVTLAGEVIDAITPATRFMGELQLDGHADAIPFHTPLTIELSDGRSATTTFLGPVRDVSPMRPHAILAGVDAGTPLVFSREEPTAARTVALLDPRYKSVDVFGPAKRVREIDLVARETLDALKISSECRYQGASFTFEAHDSKLTLIERRTR